MPQPKKQLSRQAQVAKIIREHLKSIGIKGSVTSESFSMGNAVDVNVTDIDPQTLKKLKDFCEPYEYGTFDGMTDCQGYKNQGLGIPQTKYLHVNVSFTGGMYQAAWEAIRSHYAEFNDTPERYKDAVNIRVEQEYVGVLVYQFLNGSTLLYAEQSKKFWEDLKPKAQVIPLKGAPVVGTHIEQHLHTKHGFTMYMVVLGCRISAEQFNSFRDQVKTMGGWYSKAWGQTPGGFAFKEPEKAEAFLAVCGGAAANDLLPSSEQEVPHGK